MPFFCVRPTAKRCSGCSEWGYQYEDYGPFVLCNSCEEEKIEEDNFHYDDEVDSIVESIVNQIGH